MFNDELPIHVSVNPVTGNFIHHQLFDHPSDVKGLRIYTSPKYALLNFHPTFSQDLEEFTELEYLRIEWPMFDWRSHTVRSLPTIFRRLISLPTMKALDIICAQNFMVDVLSEFCGSRLRILNVALGHQSFQADLSPRTSISFAKLTHLTIQGSRNLEILSGYPNWNWFIYVVLFQIKSLCLITTLKDASSECSTIAENFLIALENQAPGPDGKGYQTSLKNLCIVHTYPSKDPQMYYPWYPYTLVSLYKSITNLEVILEISEADEQLLNMQHINNLIFDWFYDIATPTNHSFKNNSNFSLSLTCRIAFPEGLKNTTNFRQKITTQVTNYFKRLNRHLDGIWDERFYSTKSVGMQLVLHNSGTKTNDWRELTHGTLSPNPHRWNTGCRYRCPMSNQNECRADGDVSGMPILSRGFYFHVLSVDN